MVVGGVAIIFVYLEPNHGDIAVTSSQRLVSTGSPPNITLIQVRDLIPRLAARLPSYN